MFLQDQGLTTQIRQVLASVQQATTDLGHAPNRADALISDFQSRHLSKKADETIGVVMDAASKINESAKEIGQTMAQAVGADKDGVVGGVNINQS